MDRVDQRSFHRSVVIQSRLLISIVLQYSVVSLADSTLAPVSNVTAVRLSVCSNSVKLSWNHRNFANLESAAFHVDVLKPRSEWETVAEGLTATSLLYNLTEEGEYSFKVEVQAANGMVSQPEILTKNFSNTGNLLTDVDTFVLVIHQALCLQYRPSKI